jgi:O-antigen/teichoic acid export membrane protein
MILKTMPATPLPQTRFGARRLYRDAGAVATSSVANAVLGVAFWAVAAKIFLPEQLGVMTAVLAVIVSTSLVLAAGVGDAYSALLPAVGNARPGVYRRGQRLLYGLATAVGIVAALVTTASLSQVRGSIAVGVLICVGIVAWSAVTLQSSTLVALGRARWLPLVNTATSLAKIGLLPLLAFAVQWHAVELSFIAAALVTVVVLRPIIANVIHSARDLPPPRMPEHTIAPTFNRFTAQTIASSTLSLGLITLTPFLVTAFAGPGQGALFALALSVTQALDFVGSAMAVSLAVHASSSPEEGGAMARAILIRAVLLVALGSAVLIGLTPMVLRFLNPAYSAMGAITVIAVMCAGSVVRTVYMVWASLQRSRRKMKVPLTLNVVSGVLLLATMPMACASHGALGGALALLIASALLSAGAGGHYITSSRNSKLVGAHG